MANEIYIVTDGEYDRYCILAVYSDKKLAERFQELYGGEIEEYVIDPFQSQLKEGLTLFQIFMRKDGTVDNIQKFLPESSLKTGVLYFSSRVMAPFDEFFVYQLVSDSEEEAVRITNEKRIEILSEGLWGQGYLKEIKKRIQ